MRKVFVVVSFLVFAAFRQAPPTEVIVLGTVHQPVENFNVDSLYNLLVKIQPDIILHELDSSFFTETLELKEQEDGGLEHQATVKYAQDFPVKIRPYEFEGRNEYRVEQGIRPTDGFVWELLDSLYEHGKLNKEQRKIMERYYQLTDSLNSFAFMGARAFNNSVTDEVARERQSVQYQELQTITNQRKEFAKSTHTKPNGEKITYREAYQLAGAFWDLRNQTMARNILTVVKQNPGARIVVLNGYFHRYYLISKLKKQKEKENFIIKDFYEY